MIRGQSVKQLYESLGPRQFVRRTYQALGLTDEAGRRHTDRAGNSVLVNPRDAGGREMDRFRPAEYSLRDLAESLVGEDWAEQINPGAVQRVMLQEDRQGLLEAGTGAIGPGNFVNINAFTAVVAGLLEVSVLEGWKNPAYIADDLMPAENTRMFEGRKVIGVTRAGDVAEQRYPGMPTKRINIGERWISQPRTVENALSSEVTQEAVYLDLTGEVMQEANDLGTWIGWRKEIRCIDCFIGVTNTYTYKGTTYNTYVSNGYFNNSITGNELTHWTNIQTAEILFRDMLDPETGLRVLIQPNSLLVNREKWHTANAILGATNVQFRDSPGSTTNAQQIREFPNPVSGRYKVLESPLVFQRCTDATGLNLSATNAGKIWWMYERGKAFKYAQNWPMRVQQAAPNQTDMIDRGVVLFVKADERGVPMVYEPRRTSQHAA